MTISEKRNRMQSYEGASVCPKDFLPYWQDKMEQLGDLQITREPIQLGNPCAVYEQLQIQTQQGETVAARYIRPAGSGDSYPTLLMYHDMGRGVRGWHHMTRFAGIGYAVIALENRIGTDVTMETIDQATLEQCYVDALTVAKAALLLPETNEAQLAAWGEGFGGGLAMAVSAVLPQEVHCACLHPMPAELPAELGYLDIENFACYLHAPLLMGTAMMDETASPWGQYASYHRAPCSKRQLVYPKYAHERINAFENEHIKFLNLWREEDCSSDKERTM